MNCNPLVSIVNFAAIFLIFVNCMTHFCIIYRTYKYGNSDKHQKSNQGGTIFDTLFVKKNQTTEELANGNKIYAVTAMDIGLHSHKMRFIVITANVCYFSLLFIDFLVFTAARLKLFFSSIFLKGNMFIK